MSWSRTNVGLSRILLAAGALGFGQSLIETEPASYDTVPIEREAVSAFEAAVLAQDVETRQTYLDNLLERLHAEAAAGTENPDFLFIEELRYVHSAEEIQRQGSHSSIYEGSDIWIAITPEARSGEHSTTLISRYAFESVLESESDLRSVLDNEAFHARITISQGRLQLPVVQARNREERDAIELLFASTEQNELYASAIEEYYSTMVQLLRIFDGSRAVGQRFEGAVLGNYADTGRRLLSIVSEPPFHEGAEALVRNTTVERMQQSAVYLP